MFVMTLSRMLNSHLAGLFYRRKLLKIKSWKAKLKKLERDRKKQKRDLSELCSIAVKR